MHESGVLVVSAQARELARAVMAPPLATVIWPAAYLNRLVTVGLLPSGTRTQYGYRWSPALERRMDRAFTMLRAARRVTPDILALWPESRIENLES
jgi:uncharacterized protein (DUF2236 family)